eukprot:1445640-Amphidinium_carterae.1
MRVVAPQPQFKEVQVIQHTTAKRKLHGTYARIRVAITIINIEGNNIVHVQGQVSVTNIDIQQHEGEVHTNGPIKQHRSNDQMFASSENKHADAGSNVETGHIVVEGIA